MPFYLDDQHREWIYTLQIAGLTYRYTSSTRASTSPIEGHPTAALYVDVPAILAEEGVSAIDERLDLMRSSYDGGSMTIRLARLRDMPGDPARIFGRSGRRAATAYALVTRSVGAGVEVPFELHVDADLSALSFPRLVHVGVELMYATEAQGDGSDGDPWRLTITARAMGGSRLAEHIVDAVQLDFPILTTDEVCFFPNRPAVVLAEPADGSEPPCVFFRGYLADPPRVERDGSVTVEILSLAAITDAEVSVTAPAESTKLVTGYHPFFDGVGSIFECWQETPVFFGNTRDGTAAASGKLDANPQSVTQWLERFDPDLPFGHPRAGDLSLSSDPDQFYEVTGTSDDGAISPGSFDLAAGPAVDVRQGDLMVVRGGVEAKRAYLIPPGEPPEILVWPGTPEDLDDGAVNRINSQLDTTSILDDGGAFVGVGLAVAGEGAITARFTRNAPTQLPALGGGNRIILPDWRVEELTAAQGSTWRSPDGPLIRPLTSWSTFDPTTWANGEPQFWFDGVERAPSRVTEVMSFPLVWKDPNVPQEWDDAKAIYVVPNDNPIEVPLFDVATAFYQRGEPYVLVEDAIDVTDGIVTVAAERDRVFAVTRGQGSRVRFQARVVDVEAVVLANGPRAGDTVYKLIFADPLNVPSFGEFGREGMEAGVSISAPREDFFSSPLAALRWLLTNQNARGLTDEEVDLASIDRLPAVPWAEPFNLPGIKPDGSIKLRDLLDGIHRLTRTALVMRGPDAAGRTRLTLISTGFAVGAEAVAVLDASNIAAEPVPSSDLNAEVLNSLQVDSNYDEEEEEFAASSRYFEKASIATHGRGSLDTIAGYGFIPRNPSRTFAPAARALFDTFSEHRRIWRLTVATHTGLRLPVGSVVQVTHPELLDHRGEPVVLGTGIVTARRLELWAEGCELTIESYDRVGAGWNAALRVTAVVSDTAVRVAANAHSDPTNPSTGANQADVDAFAVGDTVVCEPAADHGAAVEREIVSITPATDVLDALVTFDDDHGLAVGDSVVPTAYASASALHRRYAYLSAGSLVMV